ncbi:N-acetylglucosamine kinase-like BadF-type ATPase [Rhizobium skierniewicense]|uniref:N-acetylglucosamine kinase-like BadF-type ATPase n=1 Tax=Rhizobium skierniewicense TaxID=984260 RepID=A0A7W6C576_9HYPH|nr:hypothetical protein [Rhizobium skierniewicense]MBB3944679.1 N-acetylglucosamine kinase-like BadF-type ATPase [Rhizobium skierniewicense]
MRQEYDYEKILVNVESLTPKLREPASEGDLLKVYTAMALQQEAILDAMGALSAMVSNVSLDEKLRKFGETFQNSSNYISIQTQELLKKANVEVADHE